MSSAAETNPGHAQRLRDQESLLILLNVGILGSLIAIHLVFAWTRLPSVWFAVDLFVARLAMQLVELAWLRGRFAPVAPAALQRYAQLAVWVHVGFACLASLLSGIPDSHYIVLMVLPTVAAAFRRSWFALAAVVLIAGVNTFVYVGLAQPFDSAQERHAEYFEAAANTLTYLAVAMVVRVLVVLRRAQQQRLQSSLDELKRTRDQLVQEEKLSAVGRLAAGIAHEIRNPVGMIASAVALAEQPNCAAEVRDEMCGIVAQECRRLERLTTDFLSFARQTPPQRKLTSARTTLEYIAGLIRPRAAERNLAVRVQCSSAVHLELDAGQIQQALLNLGVNAIDATPPGGSVTLGAERERSGVALLVENTGPCIADESCARLFEPFFTTKPEGTGLGLAICRRVARAHGGDVALTVNEPGRVRFSLFIPDATPAPRDGELCVGPDSDR